MDNRIRLDVEIHPIVTLKLHDLEYGIMEIDHKDIERVRTDCGKTMILYKTGFEDKPIDGFYVKESVEEVNMLIEKAKEIFLMALISYKAVKVDQNEQI